MWYNYHFFKNQTETHTKQKKNDILKQRQHHKFHFTHLMLKNFQKLHVFNKYNSNKV